MRVSTIALALVLLGCDSFYGVLREMKSSIPISQDCINRALSATEGVTDVKYTVISEKESYRYRTYAYDYSYKTLRVRLAVDLDSSNAPTFTHHYRRNNRVPPQQVIDVVRPLMARVERNLELVCDIPGAAEHVEESCRGVSCDPLHSASEPLLKQQ